jgi:hypothetical protein
MVKLSELTQDSIIKLIGFVGAAIIFSGGHLSISKLSRA